MKRVQNTTTQSTTVNNTTATQQKSSRLNGIAGGATNTATVPEVSPSATTPAKSKTPAKTKTPAKSKVATKPNAPAVQPLTTEEFAIAKAFLYIMDVREKDGVKRIEMDKDSDPEFVFIKANPEFDEKAASRASGSIARSARTELGGKYIKTIHGYSWPRAEFVRILNCYSRLTDEQKQQIRAERESAKASEQQPKVAEQSAPVSEVSPSATTPSEPTMTVAAAKALLKKQLRDIIAKTFLTDEALNARVEEAFKNIKTA